MGVTQQLSARITRYDDGCFSLEWEWATPFTNIGEVLKLPSNGTMSDALLRLETWVALVESGCLDSQLLWEALQDALPFE